MTSYTYKIHHVPTSDEKLFPFLAGKFASLRLSALATSPTSFSSTFEIESAFTSSQWIQRLRRPLVNTFVAVAYGASTPPEQQTIDAGDWVGSATLLGPFPKTTFELPESGGPVIGTDEEETKWHMTALYNSPNHRGRGIAKMLIRGILDFAIQQSGPEKSTRLRIMVHPANVVVKNLYNDLGFVEAGKMTLAEAYLANGDAELLPPDRGASDPGRYNSRRGIIMEKLTAPSC